MRPAASPLHRARLGKDEVAVVMDPATGQLLKYEDLGDTSAASRRRGGQLAVDAHLFGEYDVLTARTDLLDCQALPPPPACGSSLKQNCPSHFLCIKSTWE